MIETSPSTPARVDAVLPRLDETGVLPWVLDRSPAGRRAIAADGGSTDGSADIARDLGAYVAHEPRRGFGAACHAGLTAATADVVCFSDCDAPLAPALLPVVVGPVKVTGTRRGTWQEVRGMRAVLGDPPVTAPPVTAPAVTAATVPGAGR